MKNINHLAVIMDGNGRWAQKKGRPRFYGHIQGVRTAKKIISSAQKMEIPFLTLYAFSSENWNRPLEEVKILMSLLKRYLLKEKSALLKSNIRFQVIGQIERLPKEILPLLTETIRSTSKCTGMTLTLALSYSGREDILNAAKKLAYLHLENKIDLNRFSDSDFSILLDTSTMPDPDLIIRTSGEKRLSNFLLWQSAYTEFFFTEKHWPDFTEKDLKDALFDFQNRDRRFGRVSDEKVGEGLPFY